MKFRRAQREASTDQTRWVELERLELDSEWDDSGGSWSLGGLRIAEHGDAKAFGDFGDAFCFGLAELGKRLQNRGGLTLLHEDENLDDLVLRQLLKDGQGS